MKKNVSDTSISSVSILDTDYSLRWDHGRISANDLHRFFLFWHESNEGSWAWGLWIGNWTGLRLMTVGLNLDGGGKKIGHGGW